MIQPKPTADKDEKYCPRCQKVLPLEAFRRATGRPKDRDCYCKACRRADAVEKRPRENARWTRYRKAQAADGNILGQDRKKKNARQKALYHHDKPKRCIVPKCTNRGERHHHLGYDAAHAADIIPLCRKHHALEHLLERARVANGPTYF